jgi:hypothetical protein
MQAAVLADAIRTWGLGSSGSELDSDEDAEEVKESSKHQAVWPSVLPTLAVEGAGEKAVIVVMEEDGRKEESALGGWTSLAPTMEGLEVGQAAQVDDEGILCESL